MAEEIAFENGRISNFQWLATLTLELGSGHTAYLRASLIDLYLHAKFHWNRRNFLWTDGRTFETHLIRSTQKSRPKNWKSVIVYFRSNWPTGLESVKKCVCSACESIVRLQCTLGDIDGVWTKHWTDSPVQTVVGAQHDAGDAAHYTRCRHLVAVFLHLSTCRRNNKTTFYKHTRHNIHQLTMYSFNSLGPVTIKIFNQLISKVSIKIDYKTTVVNIVVLQLLFTHAHDADGQSVNISVTVCLFVCLYGYGFLLREQRRSPKSASNFAHWFIQGRRGQGIFHFGELCS